MKKFQHLQDINQSYPTHFKDAIGYSGRALKSSVYFFFHAIWPDAFKKDGSEHIKSLHETIQSKYRNNI